MKNRSSNKEKGQVIVIFALALVGLLSFTALAVDIGRTWNDRRYDQNVADSAALTGGQAAMNLVKLQKASQFNCDTGGFFVTSMSDPHWVKKPNWLGANDTKLTSILNSAITSAANNNKADLEIGVGNQNGAALACGTDPHGSYVDLKVMVSGETVSMFAHFFNRGQLRNSVESVARIYPRTPALDGYGIYAFDSACTEGIVIKGGGGQPINVEVDNGGIFSSSCISSTGHGTAVATKIDCMKNNAHPNWCDVTDTNFTPRLNVVEKDPMDFQIDAPNCSDRTIAPERTVTGNVLEPGYYPGGIPGHQLIDLKPGLYCIEGSVLLNGGASIKSIDFDGKSGVTLVFMNGGFSTAGNGFMNISAASTDPASTSVPPNVIPGVAVIFPTGNSSEFDMGGNSDTKIIGTVYAPESRIILGGTGDNPLSTQWIGFSFDYHGTEMQYIYYDGDMFYQLPPSLSLYK